MVSGVLEISHTGDLRRLLFGADDIRYARSPVVFAQF
jgi:hypothetical protein